MTTTVHDNAAASRFEVHDRDRLAGWLDYRLDGDILDLTHTDVMPDYRGKRLAGRLVRAALSDARVRSLHVVPSCGHVRKAIAGDPGQYLHLVPADRRSEFGLHAVP